MAVHVCYKSWMNDMNDHRSCIHNLSSCEIKAWKEEIDTIVCHSLQNNKLTWNVHILLILENMYQISFVNLMLFKMFSFEITWIVID